MKKRWIAASVIGALLFVGAVLPVGYIETACRPGDPSPPPPARYLTDPKDRRPFSNSLLTYPEWHIVYAADSQARWLLRSAPSAYSYSRDVRNFWTSYCAVNRHVRGEDVSGYKVMIYTIGISFNFEMLAKAAYENTLGRLFEAIGGYDSSTDVYAQQVQTRYGAFMHETPWYRFDFTAARQGLWRTPGKSLRDWERRVALSLEYGFKGIYAGLIGWASGTTLGSDEVRMRGVIATSPEIAVATDARLRPVRVIAVPQPATGDGPLRSNGALSVVDMPRYAQFTEIAEKLSDAGVNWRELAGNDAIMISYWVRSGTHVVGVDTPFPGAPTLAEGEYAALFTMALPEEPGWERRAAVVPVAALSAALGKIKGAGGRLEHIYDY